MGNTKQIKAYQFRAKQFEVVTPEQARYSAEAGGRDIMAEYAQMRKVANERLRKLKKAGLTDTVEYRENVNRFPSRKEIGTDLRMLYDAVADVTHFLAGKKTTVGGYHESTEKAIAKFSRHYASEGLVGMDWKTFGKMMESIKSHARSNAYYRGWKNAYRSALSNARKRGMSAEELNKKVSEGLVKIGPRGGLKDVNGRRLR